MADFIRFAHGIIPGTPEHVAEEPTFLQHRLLHFWGLTGAGAITGRSKQRVITVRHVLHDQYTAAALEKNKLALAGATFVGSIGQLQVVNNNKTSTFKSCLFIGWEALPEPEHGPLPDAAGTLDGGWWQRIYLRWVHLTEES